MTIAWLLVALAVVPVLVVPGSRLLGHRTGWTLSVVFLALAAALVPTARDVLDGAEPTASRSWIPALDVDLALRLDGLGLVFVMIALVIGAAVFAYSSAYLPPGPQVSFYLWMTVFAFGMVGLVLADDLVLLFLCWEITSFASFLLIARSGSGGESASMRTLLMTFVGGLTLLVAVVLIIAATGTTSVSAALASPVWHEHGAMTTTVAVLVAVSGFTKAAQFPFHPWLPDAMAASTPVSAYLHAAAVVKAGIYLMLRFSEAFSGVPVWNALLIGVGLFTAAMGGLFALGRTDLKRLMAYSTVSQLGFITAAIGVGTPLALTAAVLHTIAHALFKSGLFMAVGIVDHQAGSRDIRRLPTLWRLMPWTFATVIAGTAAMAGLPPLLGFVSKEMILGSMLDTAGPAWAAWTAFVVATLAAVLTFAYCGKIVLGAFIDGERDLSEVHVDRIREARPALLLPAALPIWAGLPLGLGVVVLDEPVSRAVEAITGTAGYALHLWHGLTPELVATVVVVVAGLAVVLQRRWVRPRVERELLPLDGAQVIERLVRGADRAGGLIARSVGVDHPGRHVGPPLALLTLLLGGGTLAVVVAGDVPAAQPDLARPVDGVLLALVTLGVVGVCRTGSRIAATVFLGGVGIAVTVQLFALGAPDVGLTQLMVEVLTVVVIMLVLRGLPADFGHRRHHRRRTPILMALALGAAAGAGTWLLTGRRGLSEPAQYFIAEGAEETGGDNLVNVILVEFRALDTLGELTVLGFAGIAIVAVLATVPRTAGPPEDGDDQHTPGLRPLAPLDDPQAAAALASPEPNLRPLRLVVRLLVPLLAVLSALIFWRGHNEPGGGFIAALVGAAAVALVYLSRPDDRPVATPAVNRALIGGGVLLAIVTGLLGYARSSFLEPIHGYLGSVHLSTSMLFDVGVYLAVLGLVMVAFDQLGSSDPTRSDSAGGRGPRASTEEAAR